MEKLSVAFFELHPPDVLQLKERLLKQGLTQQEIDKLPHAYFKSRYSPSHLHVMLTAYTIMQHAKSCLMQVSIAYLQHE